MQTMTSMCEIWWKQVGGSLRLVQAVVEHLQQEESLVLRTPKHIPWESTFEELLQNLMQKPIDEIKELYNNREIEK